MESLNILQHFAYTYTGIVKSICKRGNMQDNQSQTHWIYAAGIMDSDGCFMISKRMSNNKKRIEYMPLVKIAMITDRSLKYIREKTGLGNILINGTRPSRPKSLPIYEWRITKVNDLLIFLNNILPYLQNKKERAEHLLNFCAIGNYKNHKDGHRLTKEELNYREQAYLEMRKLNGSKVGATTKSLGPEKGYAIV